MFRRLLAGCMILGLCSCSKSPPPQAEGEPPSGETPREEVQRLLATNEPFDFDFEVENIDGNKLSKSDFSGKVLIVDIWGTWCPPCRLEIPHFVRLHERYKARGLQIVGLNDEQTSEKEAAVKLIREFVEKEGVPYPCALITPEILDQVPDFEGFPTTLFLDRTGKVRMKVVGYHPLPFLEAAVEHLLDEQAVTRAAD